MTTVDKLIIFPKHWLYTKPTSNWDLLSVEQRQGCMCLEADLVRDVLADTQPANHRQEWALSSLLFLLICSNWGKFDFHTQISQSL